ncbi:aminotransferase class IV, partial [Staphylococcus arlettae]
MDYQIFPLTTKNHFTAKLQCVSQHVPKAYVINKTSQREHLRHNHETDLILLYNEEGKILEFDIGNIVIKED